MLTVENTNNPQIQSLNKKQCGSGDAVGDTGGDPATPSPAVVQAQLNGGEAPERPLNGRFWVLQSSDDEAEEEDAMAEASPFSDADSFRYLCRTPEVVDDRDLFESTQELARRAIKRLQRRQVQRTAAMDFMAMKGTLTSPLSTSLGRSTPKSLNLPVLEPSVFHDDGQEGWTVVHRRRWSPELDTKTSDPVIKPVISGRSKNTGMGLNFHNSVLPIRNGPARTARYRPIPRSTDRSVETQGPIQVKVGGAVAGHAFRHLLGFAWRKIEKGEQVVQQPPSRSMSGDGGHGGFNPGRGAFNQGRGGFQSRGGFAAGRGGNARGRMGQGGGRGGRGFNGGRGYQGTGHTTSARNFVQGESSGTAGGGNFTSNREENWGGQRNYNSNFYSNNRAGYGNNQMRWVGQNNVGRGGAFQPRFRGNNDAVGATARGPIDAELLHQTVQAVVAAVAAAQKTPEVMNGSTGAAGVPDPKAAMVNPTVTAHPVNKAVEPMGVQGARENEGAGNAKKKKDDKEVCFRCKKPGHFIDDCTTPYCDICESIHHISSACHLLQAPKPTAILHGYANEALMFFEMPCGAFKAKVENPKLVKVSVEGEVMTIPEIIEHMKKIVPSEKFHWEVYHYKDNVYRVKLPSKQEVQRLKNFGSYVCPLKDTVLFFDYWSSVEEPLYMLPEVWVRVDGLPSDMRADYLSLWGIGSLFGKTLDVDMPFTRKNKLLRIKIGCLDRNLIPLDSDVFIRRGFYKLHFEVEIDQVAQEVNMAEASEDKNGDGDPNNGLGNGDGHNDMDMDAKGADDEGNANNNGQHENGATNGVEGMQEQCAQVEEINIGTLKVPLSPLGNDSLDSNLTQKYTVFLPILHAQKHSLKDEICADYYADFGSVTPTSGLPRDRKHVALDTVLSADSGHLHADAAATGSVGQQHDGMLTTASSPSVQPAQVAASRHGANPSAPNAAQERVAVGCGALPTRHAGDKHSSGATDEAGSDAVTPLSARRSFSVVSSQKIQPHAATVRAEKNGDRANHWTHNELMMRAAENGLGGSSVHAIGMSNTESLHNLNFDDICVNINFTHHDSHECHDVDAVKQVDHDGGSSLSHNKGEVHTGEVRGILRDASSFNNNGAPLTPFENSSCNVTQDTPISLVDIDHVSHCPSIEEVIAFGGIPRPTGGVRSSARLGGQPNADMPQMEKAMKKAQMKDVAVPSGYSYGFPLGPAVGSAFSGGTAGCHGFWLHTAPDGRSGYLVPGWLAAY
ncbi:hypothetical protein QYE76_003363 [Lolium multiflorum]|uniref:CCHC-type domain-containing protein n=1 Tax=Lolium multiflorum TaxID=4521 RepID=A0AAD8RPY6_LOLMU|nr:hypothetical protein QYE76_003339 [Lolium multiflorum]KAK1629048.1 hypothetical protein QYE76_003363 [Lolium multiflorum]